MHEPGSPLLVRSLYAPAMHGPVLSQSSERPRLSRGQMSLLTKAPELLVIVHAPLSPWIWSRLQALTWHGAERCSYLLVDISAESTARHILSCVLCVTASKTANTFGRAPRPISCEDYQSWEMHLHDFFSGLALCMLPSAPLFLFSFCALRGGSDRGLPAGSALVVRLADSILPSRADTAKHVMCAHLCGCDALACRAVSLCTPVVSLCVLIDNTPSVPASTIPPPFTSFSFRQTSHRPATLPRHSPTKHLLVLLFISCSAVVVVRQPICRSVLFCLYFLMTIFCRLKSGIASVQEPI